MRWMARSINGEAKMYRPSEYQNYLRTMEGKEIEIITGLKQEELSQDQRAYYRATLRWLVDNIEMFGGYSEEELHQEFINMFSSYTKTVEWNGEIAERIFKKSTSDMTKKEMSEFIDKVLNWLGSQDVICPPPSEAIIGKYKTVVIPENKVKGVKLILPEEDTNEEEQQF